jgi:general nucleoside transport system permease protein
MIRLEARQQHSQAMIYLSPLIAIILTLLSGLVIFALFGKNPVIALYTFFVLPLTDFYSVTELLVKATPLILIGVGLSIGFRANVWNIGAEGQLTMGAIFGGGLAVWLHDSSSMFLLPGMIILGALGGALYGAIPALLKTRYGVNEILTSLMLTYVATLFLSYLVTGPWRDPDGYNFPQSRTFSDAGLMPIVLEESRLHFGAILALLVVITGWVLMAKSVIGFQLKVVGLAPAAAKHVGFVENKLIWFSLCLGGALAGIAGVSEVAGPIGQLNPSISPGYGFTAIIVAFLGRLHPVGVVFAGLVMALTYIGGETAQIEIGTPAAVTGLFQGILLFFLLASDVLTSYRIRFGRPQVTEGGAS